MVKLNRFDICLVNLDPTIGSEMKKTRPVVIISPDTMNFSRLKTIIVAPMTSTVRDDFPTRVTLNFNNKKGQIALDQVRSIDRARIIKILGSLDADVENNVLNLLGVMFQR
jgi:mRNA interferase MazF